MEITLDIIIVNTNNGHQLHECLLSLSRARRDGYSLGRVVVIDNASTDGSADDLIYPVLPLVIIRNGSNRGFAAACNQGAAGSSADYLLFLNPDTRVLDDTLAKSVQWMESPQNSRVGILGVQLLDEDGTISRTCARFPTLGVYLSKMLGLNWLFPRIFPDHFYTEWDHRASRKIEQVIGAYFLIRNSVFRELNGFDERFFVYFEEVDLSLRALRAGWSSYYLAEAQCFHHGGKSSTARRLGARHGFRGSLRQFYFLRSRLFYAFKNFGTANAFLLFLATLFIEPIPRVGRAVAQGSIAQIREVFHGYLLLWRALPTILRSQYLRELKVFKLESDRFR